MERNYLEGILLQLDMADSEEVLREIEIELAAEGYVKQRVKRQRSAKQELQEPARYRSRDGIVILVGRNNRQNDLVTFRLSSPRHLWLHARNMPGSHVVVLAEGEIPEQTLQDAARLAAYFSKGRESNSVPVDYTERRHVRKPKEQNRALSLTNRRKPYLSIPLKPNYLKNVKTRSRRVHHIGHLHLPLVTAK